MAVSSSRCNDDEFDGDCALHRHYSFSDGSMCSSLSASESILFDRQPRWDRDNRAESLPVESQ